MVIKDLLNFNQSVCKREKSIGALPIMRAPSDVSPVYRSSNSKLGFGQHMFTGMAGLNVTVVSGNGANGEDQPMQSFTSFKMATNYFLRNPSLNFMNKNTYGAHLQATPTI